jgi:hypothetical protein
MFEHLAEHRIILVTGPQRAGTRICSKMIAYDLEYTFVDEDEICVDSLNRLWRLVESGDHLVVQCPALCSFVHLLTDQQYVTNPECVAVVFMLRDPKDILASQRRINWGWETPELMRYNAAGIDACCVKRYEWNRRKATVPNSYEVEYESLAGHSLWVPKDQRKEFAPVQTAVEA